MFSQHVMSETLHYFALSFIAVSFLNLSICVYIVQSREREREFRWYIFCSSFEITSLCYLCCRRTLSWRHMSVCVCVCGNDGSFKATMLMSEHALAHEYPHAPFWSPFRSIMHTIHFKTIKKDPTQNRQHTHLFVHFYASIQVRIAFQRIHADGVVFIRFRLFFLLSFVCIFKDGFTIKMANPDRGLCYQMFVFDPLSVSIFPINFGTFALLLTLHFQLKTTDERTIKLDCENQSRAKS